MNKSFKYNLIKVILFPICTLLIVNFSVRDVSSQYPGNIASVTELKNRCEAMIKLVKQEYQDKINDPEFKTKYKKTQILYSEAQGAVNGWVEDIKYNLIKNKKFIESGQYKLILEKAANKSTIFLNYSEEMIVHDKGFSVDIKVPDIIKALSSSAREWVESYQKAKKERKKELLDRLDQSKWKDFSEIK